VPTFYREQAYQMDPFGPPAPGTPLVVVRIDIEDRNDDDMVGPATGPFETRDQINGAPILYVFVGDTVTVEYPDGTQQTIAGVTFYLVGEGPYFTPTDGTFLEDAIFVSSTFVLDSTDVSIPLLFPPCFVAGTPILTPGGDVAVEMLSPGDLVMTLDHGPQALVWVGCRTVSGRDKFAPVRFVPGAIGNPVALEVSPQHRMLIGGWRAEILFGEPEVLVAAVHLVDGDRITRAPRDRVTYVHLLFDRHEIVLGAGVPSESFNPGATVLKTDHAIREELVELFPGLHGGPLHPMARPLPPGAEARALRRMA
jgi:hypothetical protein